MDMKKYDIKINITLTPQYNDVIPHVICGIDDQILLQKNLDAEKEFIFESNVIVGEHRFFIKFNNKKNSQSKYDKDMAVKIKHIGFQNLPNNFHYFSKYKPEYPTKWLQQQKEIGKVWEENILSDHMGWNGIYYIDFEAPIYRWIHKKLNLGWLI